MKLEWAIGAEGDTTIVALKGAVNEDADFEKLAGQLSPMSKVRLDLAGVTRVNSCGVREWVKFVRDLPSTLALELERCPPVVVAQINMVTNFASRAKVLSVFAPFACEACNEHEDVLIPLVPGIAPRLQERSCPRCQARMEFDDLEDSYFAFIQG